MKTIYILLSVFLLTAAVAITSFVSNHTRKHETTFTIIEKPTTYEVKMDYNPEHADILKKYLDSCMNPTVIFGNEDKIEKDIITADKASFHVKAKPGSFHLTANKKDNSKAAIEEILNICTGLKNVIKPD